MYLPTQVSCRCYTSTHVPCSVICYLSLSLPTTDWLTVTGSLIRIQTVKRVDRRPGRHVARLDVQILANGRSQQAVARHRCRHRAPLLCLAGGVTRSQDDRHLTFGQTAARKGTKSHGLQLRVHDCDGAARTENDTITARYATDQRDIGSTDRIGEGHRPARERGHEGMQRSSAFVVACKGRGCGVGCLGAVGEEGVLVRQQAETAPVKERVGANSPLHQRQIAHRDIVWAPSHVRCRLQQRKRRKKRKTMSEVPLLCLPQCKYPSDSFAVSIVMHLSDYRESVLIF